MSPRRCTYSFSSGLVVAVAFSAACSSAPPVERSAETLESALSGPWSSFGMPAASQIAAARGPDGNIVAFALTSGAGSIATDAQTAPNGSSWNAPSSLGGGQIQQFAVGHNADGRLEVFAIGGDGALYHIWQVDAAGDWLSSWANLGGTQLQQVATANEQDGRLRAFVLGGDGNVYTIAQTAPNGGWGTYAFVGGAPLSQIAAGTDPNGAIEIIGLATNGATTFTQETAPNSSAWPAFASLAGWASKIAVGQNADGRIEIYQLGGGGAVYHQWRTPAGTWSGWYGLEGAGTDLAVGVEQNGTLDVFIVGTDGSISETSQSGPNGGWAAAWTSRGQGPFTRVAVASHADGHLELLGLTPSGDSQHTSQDGPNAGWGAAVKTMNVSTAAFNLALGSKLDGLLIQIGQNGEDPEDIVTPACHIDYTAENACKRRCILDDLGPDCLKGCQSLQTIVCTPIQCESQPYSTFIHIPDGLKGGTQACNAADCQTCTNGQEPALFDHPLDIPDPIATFTKGLITYHCTMNHLDLAPDPNYPVFILPQGIQILLQGSTVSPALSCDNGAPDLDLSSVNVSIIAVPSVQNGSIVVSVSATLAAIVTAHDPLAQGIADIADAQNRVTSNGTAAVNKEAGKLAGQLGVSFDKMVRALLPMGSTIVGVAWDYSAGLTVSYVPPSP